MHAGDKIGHYVIVEPISVGKSGQADVYRARPADGDAAQDVALKVLAKHLRGDEASIKRMTQEANILTQLRHPNIVRLEAFDTASATPYIAQELIEGSTVADLLETDAPISLPRVLAIAQQMAEALACAHTTRYYKAVGSSRIGCTGIIHRDLSTDNVFVLDSDLVKLIDFGIARAVGVPTVVRTQDHNMGKPYYVAPEVGTVVDVKQAPTIDVYSFGVCVYEMIMTGRPERSRIEVLRQLARHARSLDAAFPADVPGELTRLVAACIERNPEDRPQSMADVSERMRALHARVEHLRDSTVARATVPAGFAVDSALLSFRTSVALGGARASGEPLRASASEDASRLVFVDGTSKVSSFNLHGGDRRVAHPPSGCRLTTVVAGRGGEIIGVTHTRDRLLRLTPSGDWETVELASTLVPPRLVPDQLVLSGRTAYIGDYGAHRIVQVDIDTGKEIAASPTDAIGELGPFAVRDGVVVCLDMVTKTLLTSDAGLETWLSLVSISDVGWPTCIAHTGDMLFVVDAQNRRVAAWTAAGQLISRETLSWPASAGISDVIALPGTTQLLAADAGSRSLLFFDAVAPDVDVIPTRSALAALGVVTHSFSYDELEQATLMTLQHGDSERVAKSALAKLEPLDDASPSRNQIMVAIYRYLHETLGVPERRGDFLLEAISIAERTHTTELCKQLCSQYLRQVIQFSPEIRDKLGAILEAEEQWDEIRTLEAAFLSSSFFADDPHAMTLYAQSFDRLRRAYDRLGVPQPSWLRVMPADQLAEIRRLFSVSTKAAKLEARRRIAELISTRDYEGLRPDDVAHTLVAYAHLIRSGFRVKVADWQDIYRALTILCDRYEQTAHFDQSHRRDREAARQMIVRLAGPGAVPAD